MSLLYCTIDSLAFHQDWLRVYFMGKSQIKSNQVFLVNAWITQVFIIICLFTNASLKDFGTAVTKEKKQTLHTRNSYFCNVATNHFSKMTAKRVIGHPRPTQDTAGYVTFCRPSSTDRFGLFQNAGKLDHIHLFHDCNSSCNGTSSLWDFLWSFAMLLFNHA